MLYYLNDMINLTDSAIKQITKLSNESAQKDQHMRIFVEAGGCSGFEYGMSLIVKKRVITKLRRAFCSYRSV